MIVRRNDCSMEQWISFSCITRKCVSSMGEWNWINKYKNVTDWVMKQLRHQNSNVAKNAKLMKINFPVTKPSLHLVHKRFELHVYIPRADISTQSWYMLYLAVRSAYTAVLKPTRHVHSMYLRSSVGKKAKLYFFPSAAFNLIFSKKKKSFII